MMSVNKVIVIGNLGRDPEVRTLPNSGQNVANYRWRPPHSLRIATVTSRSTPNGIAWLRSGSSPTTASGF
jgi:single-stranded DNA-binding protein